MLITKKKLEKIEQIISDYEKKFEKTQKQVESMNEIVLSVFVPEEEEEVTEEELQKQQEEQMQQTLELFKTAFKASINDILNNEENQEQLANYLGQLILRAQGKADPSVQIDPSKFMDQDGNINLGAVIVNWLIPRMQNKQNNTKIVPLSQPRRGW